MLEELYAGNLLGMNMSKKLRSLLAFICLASSSSLLLADVTDIYLPQQRSVDQPQETSDFDDRLLIGAGVIQQATEKLEHVNGVFFSARYFIDPKWYGLGTLQWAPFNRDGIPDGNGNQLFEPDENSVVWALGGGYAFLEGQMFGRGNARYPWRLSGEVMAGQQYTGETDGTYLGAAVIWQVDINDYWFAAEWRNYYNSDARFTEGDFNWGVQWGLSAGIAY